MVFSYHIIHIHKRGSFIGREFWIFYTSAFERRIEEQQEFKRGTTKGLKVEGEGMWWDFFFFSNFFRAKKKKIFFFLLFFFFFFESVLFFFHFFTLIQCLIINVFFICNKRCRMLECCRERTNKGFWVLPNILIE